MIPCTVAIDEEALFEGFVIEKPKWWEAYEPTVKRA